MEIFSFTSHFNLLVENLVVNCEKNFLDFHNLTPCDFFSFLIPAYVIRVKHATNTQQNSLLKNQIHNIKSGYWRKDFLFRIFYMFKKIFLMHFHFLNFKEPSRYAV